ncbi:5-carboxymethyl-2-hydroxymuconate Delta-isomerase [Wohlfahrtiimonas larvae]|uniref:5-carboxymethyl-2-hydroxymuconate isomerase n=1 Tax=Wohlfahrtiimonas larvae TaxID=1157986 RepID=A0ABP9MWE2_9GAMM|nr:hypothetical protein [Wohlfahrtiimonas larvae]
MPHVIIECSKRDLVKNCDQLLLNINQALLDTKEFVAADIKSHCYVPDYVLSGLDESQDAFISISLKIMPGRNDVVQKDMAERILSAVRAELSNNDGKNVQIMVEVTELNVKQYHKITV